jgi:hypothetical protein
MSVANSFVLCDVAPCIVLCMHSRVSVEISAAIFRVDLAGESNSLRRHASTYVPV